MNPAELLGRPGRAILGSPERRVALLAVLITIMGLADLAMTLTYMRSTGMFELNPLARLMVATGGESQLVIFKLLTLSCSAGVLYLLRRHRIVEPTAWCCALVMAALTAHWISYNHHIDNPDVWHGMQLTMSDESFVRISSP